MGSRERRAAAATALASPERKHRPRTRDGRALDLPGSFPDQRDAPGAPADPGRLELRAADHHVEVHGRAVDEARWALRPGAAEADAEGDVGGRVLVEERVVVHAAGLPDPRGGVYERDLPQP